MKSFFSFAALFAAGLSASACNSTGSTASTATTPSSPTRTTAGGIAGPGTVDPSGFGTGPSSVTNNSGRSGITGGATGAGAGMGARGR